MSKTMLINVTHVEESRVVILEDGVLAAYEIETINRTSIKGNIYNSVVESIHPSLEAAFVRLGPNLKGFLPLDGVNFHLLPQRREDRSRGKISQHLHAGQRLITQVVREPFAGKPPTVSTYFSLPGRFLVLMPGVDSDGISRKIDDPSQRDKLKKILSELKVPDGFGVIVRTAGLGQTKAELQRDLRYLLRLWEAIQKGSAATEFPGLVYSERDLVIRAIRDHLTPDISEIWIDNPETYERALEFVRDVMPTKAKIVKLHSGSRPLFNKYNLEEQIERIYTRKVPLPSGGEIVIDGTEALTAIDVNSARSARGANAEDTATQTNVEAAAEIARQLRLRDLGGLVVVDFIDMSASRNIKKVEKAMRDAMKGDKARHDITRLSKLGLMELARQRLKGAKLGATYAACPTCEGFGLVKNIEAAGLAALRKLQTRCARGDFGTMRALLPVEVAVWIQNHKRQELLGIENQHDIRLVIEPTPRLLRHEIEFKTEPRDRTESTSTLAPELRSEAPAPSEAEAADREAGIQPEKVEVEAAATEDAPSGSSGRRRRRRRRRSSEPSVEATAEAPDNAEGTPAERPATDQNVEPRAEASDTTATEGGDAAGDTPAPRKRRRRRRRRKSASAGGNGDTDTSSGGTDPANGSGESGTVPDGGEATEPTVPKHVRVDELMPAAVGGRSDGRRGGRSKGGARRGGRSR